MDVVITKLLLKTDTFLGRTSNTCTMKYTIYEAYTQLNLGMECTLTLINLKSHYNEHMNGMKQGLFHVPKDKMLSFQKEEQLCQEKRTKSKRSCLPVVQCFITLTKSEQEAIMQQ